MTFNFLTEDEEYDIPSQILKTILELHASVFLYPNMCGFKFMWSQTLVVNQQK